MGATFSEVSGIEANVKTYSHPSQADWITAHAKETGLNLVEVDRLWLRFQQLGCDANGMLTTSVFDRPPAKDDILTKNMLTAFGIHQDQDITFEQFLKIMLWATRSTIDSKIRAIFYLLNGGQNISKDLLVRILTRTFTGGTDNQEDIAEMTQHFMLLMDPGELGYIDEERFVCAMASIPQERLSAVLHLSILPESHDQSTFSDMESTLPPMPSPTPSQSLPGCLPVPTDEELAAIAAMVCHNDWQRLANKLGFLQEDIRQLGALYPRDTEGKVLHMLTTWRDDRSASSDMLRRALEECGMNEAGAILGTSPT